MPSPFASLAVSRASLVALAAAVAAVGIPACSSTETRASNAGPPGAPDAEGAPSAFDATAAERPRTLVYAHGCTPETCGDPPSGREPTRCWKGEGASAAGAGACAWSRPFVTASGSGGINPPAPCAEGACGPEPSRVACAAGYEAAPPACSRMDDPACEWRQVCFAAPTEVPCDPQACGAQSADAVYCETPDGGVGASRACRKTGLGDCTWQIVCPPGSVP